MPSHLTHLSSIFPGYTPRPTPPALVVETPAQRAERLIAEQKQAVERMRGRPAPGTDERVPSSYYHGVAGKVWFLPFADSTTKDTPEIRAAMRGMRKDGYVKAAWEPQILTVASEDHQVQASEPGNKESEEQAAAFRLMLEQVAGGVPQLVRAICAPLGSDGYSLAEKVWAVCERGRLQGKCVLAAAKARDPDWLRVEGDEFGNVTHVSSTRRQGEKFPVSDFLYSRYLTVFDEPLGEAAFRPAYAPYWMRDTVRKLRVIHHEKKMAGMLVGTYAVADDKGPLEDALRRARSSTWLTIPEGTRVEAMALSTAAEPDYKSFDESLRDEIVTAIAFATLQILMGSAPGEVRGDSKVQKAMSDLGPWLLMAIVTDVVNTQLAPDFIDFNYPYPAGGGYPKLTFGAVSSAEILEQQQIVTGAMQAGLVPSKKYYAKAWSVQLADPNDPDDQMQAGGPPAPPGGGFGGGMMPFGERATSRFAEPPHKFSSTHVQLTGAAADRIRAMAGAVADEDLADDGREDDPHVTVRYGLHTDDPDDVRRACAGRGPVRLTLGGVSLFPGAASGKDYDVLKVDVESPDLHGLNGALATIPHTDTHPQYKPHATIAYVKAGLGEGYAARFAGPVGLSVTAPSIVFSDRWRTKTAIPLNAVESFSAWQAYTGPNGGRGWKNGSTGEVRYQVDSPDTETAGGGADPDLTRSLGVIARKAAGGDPEAAEQIRQAGRVHVERITRELAAAPPADREAVRAAWRGAAAKMRPGEAAEFGELLGSLAAERAPDQLTAAVNSMGRFLGRLTLGSLKLAFRAIKAFASTAARTLGPVGYWAGSLAVGAAVLAAPVVAVSAGLLAPGLGFALAPVAVTAAVGAARAGNRLAAASARKNWSGNAEGDRPARPSPDEILDAMVHRFGWRPYQGERGGKGWRSDSGEVRYQDEQPGDDEEGSGKTDTPRPADADLAAAVSEKKLHPNVYLVRTPGGEQWVLKGRAGKGAAAATEELNVTLAAAAGVPMPPVYHVKPHGQDAVASPLVTGTDLAKMTPGDRRAALAKVPKADLDRHALYDYLIGHTDSNLGNYMLTAGGRLLALDKEQSLGAGQGRKAAYRIPDFLSDAVQSGKAATEYQFDPANVRAAAAAGEKVAAALDAAKRPKDAAAVRRRAGVLTTLAADPTPTAGRLDAIGVALDKTAPAKRPGILGLGLLSLSETTGDVDHPDDDDPPGDQGAGV